MPENQDKSKPIEVTAKDLPLHCPMPDAPLWARHPRVFLDVAHDGKASCPYCGAKYVFTGELPARTTMPVSRMTLPIWMKRVASNFKNVCAPHFYKSHTTSRIAFTF